MAKLIRQGDHDGAEVELDREQLTFGRDDSCDVVVSNYAKLSRQHCGFKRYPDGSFTVVDFGSRNGTFVNGQRIYEETTLRHGDQVRICDGLEFTYHNPAALPPAGPSPAAAPPPAKAGEHTAILLPLGQRMSPPGSPPPSPLPSLKPQNTGRHARPAPRIATSKVSIEEQPPPAVEPVMVSPPPAPPPPPAISPADTTTRIADEVGRELTEKSFHQILGEIARKTRKKPPPDDRPNIYT